MEADLSCPPRPPGDRLIVMPEEFAGSAARYIAAALQVHANATDLVSLAVSGGKGPVPVYQALARLPDVPWNRVALYFVDERAVPPTDAESNYHLVTETLLNRLPFPLAAVYRMEADRSDLARAAEEYERILPARLHVLLLGMGEDGHTASLFPHHPAVNEERRRVLGVQGPVEPRWRMTVTPPVIRAAHDRIMLVQGERKAAAVVRALRGPFEPQACPAQLARDAVWILDEPAASRLPMA